MVELISKLREAGIKLSLDGDNLKVSAQKGALSDEIKKELSAHKEEIIQFIRSARSHEQYEAIPMAEVMETYPVTHAQKRLWILHHLESESSGYNIVGAYSIRGPLDVDCLKKALETVVTRHEILRTAFVDLDGEPRQQVLPTINPNIVLKDLRATDAFANIISDEIGLLSKCRFDLANGPLFKATLMRTDSDNYVFVFSIHHIIFDGWSFQVLIQELFGAYYALLENNPVLLKELRIQYKDFAAYQHRLFSSPEKFNRQRDFWLKTLSGELSPLELPYCQSRPLHKTYNGQTLSFVLDRDLYDKITLLSKEKEVTLFMMVVAAVNVLLFKYAGQSDILLGTTTAGRNHQDTENQIGLYINTLVLRNKVDRTMPFDAFLQQVKKVTLSAFEHQEYPFDLLVDELVLGRNTDRSPLFDVTIELHNVNGVVSAPKPSGDRKLAVSNYDRQVSTSIYDLSFEFKEIDTDLHLFLRYNTDLFNAEQIRNLFCHLQNVFASVVKGIDVPVGKIDLLSRAERQNILNGFNQTFQRDYNAVFFMQRFEMQVAKTPDEIAIVCGDRTLTYQQVNALSNQLARYIVSKIPVRADALCGVMLHRSEFFLISILAIWKTGAAYVPIEPAYPEARIGAIIENSQIAVLISDHASLDLQLQERLVPESKVIWLDDILASVRQLEDSNLGVQVSPADLSYVIYTSGSTGKPKGVMIEHLGMINHMDAKIRDFQIDEKCVLAQTASQCFDISIWQNFAPLLCGGKTVVYTEAEILEVPTFLDRMTSDGVTIFELVPSYMREMMFAVGEEGKGKLFKKMKHLIANAEVLKPDLVHWWFRNFPDVQLTNAYGATETSDDIAHYTVEKDSPFDTIPVMFRPVQNSRVYILDEDLLPCPVGVKGEICIAGICVGRGYLNDTERTNRSFIVDPHVAMPQPANRLYRTGDLGKYGPNGELFFIGRKDYQVKISGFRVELEEIEKHIVQHDQVKEAAVVDIKAGEATTLVAYVVFENTGSHGVGMIQRFLSERLPHYMIPATVVAIEKLPVNNNGKIDRRMLRETPVSITEGHEDIIVPKNRTEGKLLSLWKEILQVEQVRINDNFFGLGGNSLKAIRLANKFGKGLLVIDIFKHQTITSLAHHLDNRAGVNNDLLHLLTSTNKTPRVSVVGIPNSGGDPVSYQPLAKALEAVNDELVIYGVRLPRYGLDVNETPLDMAHRVAQEIAEEIKQKIDTPVIIYGQCNGSSLALEVTRVLEMEGVNVKAVIVGAFLAWLKPVRANDPFSSKKSDDQILGDLKILGATVPGDAEDLYFFLRDFRYDGALATSYINNCIKRMDRREDIRLQTPLHCFVGDQDLLTKNYKSKFKNWKFFARNFKLTLFPDVGHYLLRDIPHELAVKIAAIADEETDIEMVSTGSSVFERIKNIFG